MGSICLVANCEKLTRWDRKGHTSVAVVVAVDKWAAHFCPLIHSHLWVNVWVGVGVYFRIMPPAVGRTSNWSGKGFFDPVTLAETIAADGQGVGVMGETVESGTGEEVVVEDFRPFIESAITGDDH